MGKLLYTEKLQANTYNRIRKSAHGYIQNCKWIKSWNTRVRYTDVTEESMEIPFTFQLVKNPVNIISNGTGLWPHEPLEQLSALTLWWT